MNVKAIREAARGRMEKCRLCPECDGRACAGQVPGMGGAGTGASFKANVSALAAIRLNIRTLHDRERPSTDLELFGQRLATPIMAAPMTGVLNCGGSLSEPQFAEAVILGAERSGSLGWSGDSVGEGYLEAGLAAVAKAGRGVTIIKPHAKDEELICRFKMAEEAGAIALGIDVDGAGFNACHEDDALLGPKSPARLRRLREATRLPFIIKGIMTPEEALICREAGVDCIVVSNHGGRVLDHCPGVAEVLPRIAEAAGDGLTILADGGVRHGVDALKLLALGARGVLVGRPLCWGAYGGGAEGVEAILREYTDELRIAMLMTGCGSLEDISRRIIFE